MTGIVIVTYNTPALIKPQIECIEKFCKDDFEIVVIDNSNDKEAAEAIKYHTGAHKYIKVNSASHGGSQSHAWACNVAWTKLKDDYSAFLFLDHDNFPIKPFSVVEMLDGKVMAGLGQNKSKTYFWPGFVMFDRSKVEEVDFGCSSEFRLDTGGNLYKVIEQAGMENCGFFGEEYHENNVFDSTKSQYNFYSVIAGKFMHFLNSSNWAKSEHNEERINSLLNILQQRVECVAP